MKHYLLFFCISLIFGCTSGPKEQVEGDTLIRNISVIPISKDTLLKDTDVILKGNKIVFIGNAATIELSDSLDVIDGTGKYLMPALADMHVHLPETEAELKQFFTLQMMAGVTKLRSMRGRASQIQLKAEIDAGDVLAPKLYLASQAIFPNVEFSVEEVDSLVAKFKEIGYTSIKILGVDKAETLTAFANASKKYQLPLCGHSSRNLTIKQTLDTDVYTSIEHLGGYMDALDSSNAFFLEMIDLTIAKGVYNCATLDYYNLGNSTLEELNQQAGLEYVPQMRAAWMKQYQEQFAEKDMALFKEKTIDHINAKFNILRTIYAKGGKLLLSPDATVLFSVPGFSLWREMKLYLEAGLATYDILKIATADVAEFFGEDSYGTIDLGKEADLLILNKNPLENIDNIRTVEGVFLQGEYYKQKDLAALLEL